MDIKPSSWSSIFKYSSLHIFMKGTFGFINNIIFFNIFGPVTLAVIKIAEMILVLPQFLNLGISNSLMKNTILNINKYKIINNFILIKFITFTFIVSVLILDHFFLNFLYQFSTYQLILLIILLLITIIYNFSVSNNFIEGSIHKIPLINSFIIFISPILTITLGYYFLLDGWFYISIITAFLPLVYLLSNSFSSIYKNFSKMIFQKNNKRFFSRITFIFFKYKAFLLQNL